jgi:hypothetical protein
MPTQRIKVPYGPDKRLDGQEQRKLRNLVDQINARIDAIENQLAPLLTFAGFGSVICAGRCGTNGTGGISFSNVKGATVSVVGQDLRVTFAEARTVGPDGPTYMPFGVAFTAGNARFYHASAVASPQFCDLRLRDGGGGLVNVAITAVNLALFVLDHN